MRHREVHRTERIGWLRAAVLGANDGIAIASVPLCIHVQVEKSALQMGRLIVEHFAERP